MHYLSDTRTTTFCLGSNHCQLSVDSSLGDWLGLGSGCNYNAVNSNVLIDHWSNI